MRVSRSRNRWRSRVARAVTPRGAWPLRTSATSFSSSVIGTGALARLDAADELLDLLEQIPPGVVAPYLRAQLSRGRACVAAARGQHDVVERHFRAAIDTLGVLGYPYWRSVAEIDFAAWLGGQG